MIAIKGIKKNLPYIIVFTICIVIAVTSFILLSKRYKQPVAMKDIIVTSRSLDMYETINNNNITTKRVPETTNTEGYFTKRSEVIGLLAAFELEGNKPIIKDSVIEKKDIEDISFLTLNAKYAQTGDAQPGDIVDVYRVTLEDREDWIGGNEAEKVAENVIVISLSNKDGKKPSEGSKIPLGGGSSKVEVVKLGIEEKYIKNIVPGSVKDENGYVLVVTKPFEKKVSNTYSRIEIPNDYEQKEGEEDSAEKTTKKGDDGEAGE